MAAKNLVIVESPSKAGTIEKYLGSDYIVKSSYGHIRDLEGKGMAIDIENNFEPQYEVSSDKQKVVKELKKLAKSAETVWLATDEDREGEAISWHLYEALGLNKEKTKRITFNEITKPAVTKAIENPREIDINLVDAQQARRVLDRLVGFELSPVLWRKIKPSLSAGRVQSVTVRVVVEREREIDSFVPQNSYKVEAVFTTDKGEEIKAKLPSNLNDEKEAEEFLKELAQADFKVESKEVKPAKKSPTAPFTTSTLQQEAGRKLGFSPAITMRVAQKLYESGHITYMRTDSTNLSQTALDGMESEVKSSYGDRFYKKRSYATKTKGAQEAHEAIRPTNFANHKISGGKDETRLYDLIFKRTLATQMADAELERTKINIENTANDKVFVAKGEVITFEGFLKVYIEDKDEDQQEEQVDGLMPNVAKGDVLNSEKITATERFTQHPPRYTEASLVRKLEELGIGRPSTYAPTVSTIQKRNYVIREDRDGKERKYTALSLEKGKVSKADKTEITGTEKKKLFPTDLGMIVNDFLMEHFSKIMDYHFTADVEKQFDDIALGNLQWRGMISEFYKPFHLNVEDTLENAERSKGERLLGEDPKTGKPVYAKMGRYGAMIQIGETEDEEKPKFASLLKTQSITTISLDEAMELFKLPRDIGEYEGEMLQANIGRFGPYVRFGKLFCSIPKDLDPMTITLDEATVLVKEKQESEANKYIKVWDDEGIQLLNGRYGAYIKKGRKNYKLTKEQKENPESITLEMALEIIKNAK